MTIYSLPKYCTYLTIYFGDKLPPFYIGSTSIEKIQNGYHGSIKSKKYSSIWKQELKNSHHLFKTIILEKFHSRKNATYNERLLQIKFDVVRSGQFVNMAIASSKNFFPLGASEISHPMYKKIGKDHPNYGLKRSPKTREKLSVANSGNIMSIKTRKKMSLAKTKENHPQWNKPHTEETKNKISESHTKSGNFKGDKNPMFGYDWKNSHPSKIKCCCLICKQETNITSLMQHHKHLSN